MDYSAKNFKLTEVLQTSTGLYVDAWPSQASFQGEWDGKQQEVLRSMDVKEGHTSTFGRSWEERWEQEKGV